MSSNIVNYKNIVMPKLRRRLDNLIEKIELNLTNPLLDKAIEEIELESPSGVDLLNTVNKLYDKIHLISPEGIKTLSSIKVKYNKYLEVLTQIMRLEALDGKIIRLIDTWRDVKYIFIDDTYMQSLFIDSSIDFSKFKFKYNIFIKDINQYDEDSYMRLYKKVHMCKRK